MFHKKIRNFILFLILCTTCVQLTYAQEIRVIDNKGTLKKVNNNQVFEQATDPNPASPATPITVENDIWIDNSTTPNQIKIWDGTTWKLINDNSTHTGTTGELFFADTDGTPTGDPQMFWDKTNTRLFIGPRPSNTTNPSYNNELNILGATRTSGLNNSNGTQGTPSFRFTSDKNTGMFSPTSTPASAGDLLAFTTGGTEALRIDETQQVNVHKDLSVVGAYKDSNGGSGLNGQILSSTATG